MPLERITFRIAPQATPTKTGMFYGRPKSSPTDKPLPILVTTISSEADAIALLLAAQKQNLLVGKLPGSNSEYPVHMFEWFGPVPDVVPAQLPK